MTNRKMILALPFALCAASLAGAQSSIQPQIKKNDSTSSSLAVGPCVPGTTSMLIDLDGSFSVVPMTGAAAPCYRNDDLSSGSIPLSFNFDLFGQSFNSVFVNNNGNISFGGPFGTFTPSGFPVNGFPMVAPFWADVDTRPTTSGVVYMRSEANRFTVIWDHVGYFANHTDLVCTFELIITNGTDPLVGIGNNVAFCYDDMQWTTGDASGGSGGFGGTPATVGVNAGDGINFFQIGRFGIPGNAYDGPGGNTDGVDFLDDNCSSFNVGQPGNNVAPVYLNPPAGCLDVVLGNTLNFTIQAIGPEAIQTVTMTNDGGSLPNFTSVETPGNPASSACTFTPDCTQLGQHQVIFTATDNFNPAASSQLTVCINVLPSSVEYCFGDGAGNGGPDCPCANSIPANPNGCLHSGGVGAHLAAIGCPSITGDTLQIVATNLVPNKPTFFFAADAQSGGGFGIQLGDGLACIAGTRQRVGKVDHPATDTLTAPLPTEPPLSVQFPPAPGQTHNYQVFFRNQAGPCGNGFNTTNAVSVVWLP